MGLKAGKDRPCIGRGTSAGVFLILLLLISVVYNALFTVRQQQQKPLSIDPLFSQRKSFKPRFDSSVADEFPNTSSATSVTLVEDTIGGIAVLRSSRSLDASKGLVLLIHALHLSKEIYLSCPQYSAPVAALHATGFFCVALSSNDSEHCAARAIKMSWDLESDVDIERVATLVEALLAPRRLQPFVPASSLAAAGLKPADIGQGIDPRPARTIPLFALGVSGGGLFVGKIITRLRLTGVIMYVAQFSRAVTVPAKGMEGHALGASILPGGGGRFSDAWLASCRDWAAKSTKSHDIDWRSNASLPVPLAVRVPAVLPKVLLLQMPRDVGLRSRVVHSIDALHRFANVSVAPGLTSENEYGLGDGGMTAATLAGLADFYSSTPVRRVSRHSASDLGRVFASGVSPRAGISVLPLTPRPFCPWSVHAAMPWVQPAASAALFQLLSDLGVLALDDEAVRSQRRSQSMKKSAEVLVNTMHDMDKFVRDGRNSTFKSAKEYSASNSFATTINWAPSGSRDVFAYNLSSWPPASMRICQHATADDCTSSPEGDGISNSNTVPKNPLSLQLDEQALDALPGGGCRILIELATGALVKSAVDTWMASLEPQRRRKGYFSNAEPEKLLRLLGSSDRLPLPSPTSNNPIIDFTWELRGISKVDFASNRLSVLASTSPFKVFTADEEKQFRYGPSCGDHSRSRLDADYVSQRRALFWIKKIIIEILGECDSVHKMSGQHSEIVAQWAQSVANDYASSNASTA